MDHSKPDLGKTKGFSVSEDETSQKEQPRILGHYRVEGELGRGGMGIVFHAEDMCLGRRVAIKVLPRAVAQDAQALSRLEQEVRILATLDHPNIAMIYALEQANDLFFITLQSVPGLWQCG